MKFLIGYSAENDTFLFGELECYNHCFSFCCDEVRIIKADEIDLYQELLDRIEDMDEALRLDLCEYYDCSPDDLERVMYDDCDVSWFCDEVNYVDFYPDYVTDLIACEQHDPRESYISDWYIPRLLFKRLMDFWDNHHLSDDAAAAELFDWLTSRIGQGSLDDMERTESWMKKFLK